MIQDQSAEQNNKQFLKNSKSFTGAEKGTEFKDLEWSKQSKLEVKKATGDTRIEAVKEAQKQFETEFKAAIKIKKSLLKNQRETKQLQIIDRKNKTDTFRQLPIRY